MTVNRLCKRSGQAFVRLVVFVTLVAGTTPRQLFGFAEIAGGAVTLNVEASITSDSNIFGNSAEIDDIIYSVAPILAYSRSQGRGAIDLSAGPTFNRYADFGAEDSDDWRADGLIKLPTAQGSRLSGDFAFSFFDGKDIDESLESRISIRRYSTSLNGLYQAGQKIGMRFGMSYQHDSPDARPDVEILSGHLGVAYPFRQNLSVFADYRITQSESDLDLLTGAIIDHRDQSINIGVDGALTRSGALTGSASLGYQETAASAGDIGDGDGQMVARADLSWKARPRTTLGLNGQVGTLVTNSIETWESVGAGITLDQQIGRQWNATAALDWLHFTIRGQSGSGQDQVRASVGLDYVATQYFTVGCALAHYVRSQPGPEDEFTRSTIRLFGTYTF